MFGYGPKPTMHRWAHISTVVSFRLLCPSELCLNKETKPVHARTLYHHNVLLADLPWNLAPSLSIISRLLPQACAITSSHGHGEGWGQHGILKPSIHLWPCRAAASRKHHLALPLPSNKLGDPRCMAGVWHRCEH